ncbi:hypothetical protein EGW08_018884 [Elysia chlorotica]|uniref:Uncharacterized protein n=1 Tax=Elysia chlorotica TaxID=188477 RepID=A0A433SVN9_ELYCH|nr:hypothetical protein EGW08_018884 [Elysia chlorotica]
MANVQDFDSENIVLCYRQTLSFIHCFTMANVQDFDSENIVLCYRQTLSFIHCFTMANVQDFDSESIVFCYRETLPANRCFTMANIQDFDSENIVLCYRQTLSFIHCFTMANVQDFDSESVGSDFGVADMTEFDDFTIDEMRTMDAIERELELEELHAAMPDPGPEPADAGPVAPLGEPDWRTGFEANMKTENFRCLDHLRPSRFVEISLCMVTSTDGYLLMTKHNSQI